MEGSEWVDFFKWNGDYDITLRYYETTRIVTVNELYGYFVQRMKAEGTPKETEDIYKLGA